jgi:hypothetical protein
MMTPDNSSIIYRNTLFPMSDGEAHNLTDGFALAWIFFSALSAGLVTLDSNRFTLAVAAFSAALGGIWWTLSHIKRRRRR